MHTHTHTHTQTHKEKEREREKKLVKYKNKINKKTIFKGSFTKTLSSINQRRHYVTHKTLIYLLLFKAKKDIDLISIFMVFNAINVGSTHFLYVYNINKLSLFFFIILIITVLILVQLLRYALNTRIPIVTIYCKYTHLSIQ
jgi:fatty acid desaturase